MLTTLILPVIFAQVILVDDVGLSLEEIEKIRNIRKEKPAPKKIEIHIQPSNAKHSGVHKNDAQTERDVQNANSDVGSEQKYNKGRDPPSPVHLEETHDEDFKGSKANNNESGFQDMGDSDGSERSSDFQGVDRAVNQWDSENSQSRFGDSIRRNNIDIQRNQNSDGRDAVSHDQRDDLRKNLKKNAGDYEKGRSGRDASREDSPSRDSDIRKQGSMVNKGYNDPSSNTQADESFRNGRSRYPQNSNEGPQSYDADRDGGHSNRRRYRNNDREKHRPRDTNIWDSDDTRAYEDSTMFNSNGSLPKNGKRQGNPDNRRKFRPERDEDDDYLNVDRNRPSKYNGPGSRRHKRRDRSYVESDSNSESDQPNGIEFYKASYDGKQKAYHDHSRRSVNGEPPNYDDDFDDQSSSFSVKHYPLKDPRLMNHTDPGSHVVETAVVPPTLVHPHFNQPYSDPHQNPQNNFHNAHPEERYLPSNDPHSSMRSQPYHDPYGSVRPEPYHDPKHTVAYHDSNISDPYHDPNISDPYHDPNHTAPHHDLNHTVAYHDPNISEPYHDPNHTAPYHDLNHTVPYHDPNHTVAYHDPNHTVAYHDPNHTVPYHDTNISDPNHTVPYHDPNISDPSDHNFMGPYHNDPHVVLHTDPYLYDTHSAPHHNAMSGIHTDPHHIEPLGAIHSDPHDGIHVLNPVPIVPHNDHEIVDSSHGPVTLLHNHIFNPNTENLPHVDESAAKTPHIDLTQNSCPLTTTQICPIIILPNIDPKIDLERLERTNLLDANHARSQLLAIKIRESMERSGRIEASMKELKEKFHTLEQTSNARKSTSSKIESNIQILRNKKSSLFKNQNDLKTTRDKVSAEYRLLKNNLIHLCKEMDDIKQKATTKEQEQGIYEERIKNHLDSLSNVEKDLTVEESRILEHKKEFESIQAHMATFQAKLTELGAQRDREQALQHRLDMERERILRSDMGFTE